MYNIKLVYGFLSHLRAYNMVLWSCVRCPASGVVCIERLTPTVLKIISPIA